MDPLFFASHRSTSQGLCIDVFHKLKQLKFISKKTLTFFTYLEEVEFDITQGFHWKEISRRIKETIKRILDIYRRFSDWSFKIEIIDDCVALIYKEMSWSLCFAKVKAAGDFKELREIEDFIERCDYFLKNYPSEIWDDVEIIQTSDRYQFVELTKNGQKVNSQILSMSFLKRLIPLLQNSDKDFRELQKEILLLKRNVC